MIYRLRKKFIKICMLSFVAVFLLLFSIIYLITYMQTNASLDRLADVIAENAGKFPDYNEADPTFQSNSPFGKEGLTREAPFTTRFFSVRFDREGNAVSVDTNSIASVSEQEAMDYGICVSDKNADRGWIDNYRYKCYDTEEGYGFIFINGMAAKQNNRRLLASAAAVFLSGSVVVLILIVFISKWAVKPTAESYEKQKQFVTDASHELKTPLTLIRTNLDIVESEVGSNEWLDDIRDESEKMTELVGRLVTLARMDEENTPIESRSFDLSEAVSDTVSAFFYTAGQRAISLSVNITPYVKYQGDEAAVRQMVSILMDNAVKYCDPNGEISVTLQSNLGRHPVLTVDNTFQPVGETELSRLFDRFYRADKARTYGSGFGVGLSIAKAIVEKHHGEIQAQNPTTGTIRFWVRL